MDGQLGGYTSFSTVFQPYQDNRRINYEIVCAIKSHLGCDRILPPVELEPMTLSSGSKSSVMGTFQ